MPRRGFIADADRLDRRLAETLFDDRLNRAAALKHESDQGISVGRSSFLRFCGQARWSFRLHWVLPPACGLVGIG